MPPQVKVSKEEIVNAAVEIVRKSGAQAINARTLAAALGCSTQPVFSNFATMEQLQQAVISAAYDRYLAFLQKEAESGQYPRYKAFGMAYIRFAGEEKELFKLLFMRDRRGEEPAPAPDFEESVAMIAQANGLSADAARLMHLEMWTCVHGIATMMATSFLALEEELVSQMLTDVYRGLRFRHTEEGN
jgi:AcrR family transcriptional regulator